jgi:nicotinate-nucleotide adenylyltransferase
MIVPKRVGVMGGTFDPVHLGHLRAAEETVEALQLDFLLFIPAAVPPHKQGKSIVAFEHRRQMLQAAVEEHPKFRLTDIERRLPGKSYTAVTLQKLSEDCSNAHFFFVVGLDAFLEMDTWWNYLEIFRLARMVVLRRPGYDESEVLGFLRERVSPLYSYSAGDVCYQHPHLLPVHYLNNTWLDISSTRIRQLVREGKSIRYLVLCEVMHYIHTNRLYGGDELPDKAPVKAEKPNGWLIE